MSKLNQTSRIKQQSLFDRMFDSIFSTLMCAQPAKVIKYNATTRLATIELAFIREPMTYGKNEPSLPPTTKCSVPVCQMYGKSGGVVTPVNVGDSGLAIFVDREYSNFLNGSSPSTPLPISYHEDCFFLPGFHPYEDVLPSDNEHTYLSYEETTIRLGQKIAIFNNSVSFAQQQNQWEGNLISCLNDTVSALQEVMAEIQALNASIQLISNVTLPISAGGLTSPAGPVTGSTITTTPTLPPVSTAPLNSAIITLQTQINTTDNDWQLSFPELFEDAP